MTITDDVFSRWVLRPEKRPNAILRLLCVPWAGSGTSAYHDWTPLLPEDVEVWMLRLPGRESRRREALVTDLPALASEAAAGIAGQFGAPVGIFGHSSGGLIAFELARALRREHGVKPALLAISAQPAPHLPARYPPINDLPTRQFLDSLDERCHGVPEALRTDPEMQEIYVPVMRADVALEENYRYRPDEPLGCPIAAFGGQLDTESREPDLAAWREHTAAGFTLTMLPGNHFFFQTERETMLASLVEELRAGHFG
jgi:medium-chain acyl-[acyl-carrier-protein] hydrolase